MFLLFPPTPQAVKLESLRAGRTRYLVVVSRPVSKQALTASSHISVSPIRHQPPTDTVTSQSSAEIHHTTSNSNCNSISLNPTSYFNEATSSGGSRFSANMTACDNDSIDDDNTILCDNQCETESNVGSSCSRSSSNEIEESCLLGIDCNEKTTVGLVLRVLADTAIRLDGDGWVEPVGIGTRTSINDELTCGIDIRWRRPNCAFFFLLFLFNSGFSVSVCGRQHIFKPVSVQAMW